MSETQDELQEVINEKNELIRGLFRGEFSTTIRERIYELMHEETRLLMEKINGDSNEV